MIITTVTRTYQKSINTKNYGVPESWIKIEATYTAQMESGDDPILVSKMMYDQAKSDVINNTNEIVKQITDSRAAATTTPPPASTGTPLVPTGGTTGGQTPRQL